MYLTLVQLHFTVALLALLAALVVRIATHRRPRPSVRGALRAWTIVGALVIIVATVAAHLVWVRPMSGSWVTDGLLHYAVPLGAGVVAVLFLALPLGRWRPRGTATLARRTLTSFTKGWWLAAMVLVAGVIAIVSVLAGRASMPDEQGLYRYYQVDFGPNAVGTTIYGWYYSVPSLVVLGVLVVVTFVALKLVARPSLGEDGAEDAAVRRFRSRNIVAVSVGAMLLLGSLAGTAYMHGAATVGRDVYTAEAPFAILRTPMLVTAHVADFVAWFLLFSVLLAALWPGVARSTRKLSWQSASR